MLTTDDNSTNGNDIYGFNSENAIHSDSSTSNEKNKHNVDDTLTKKGTSTKKKTGSDTLTKKDDFTNNIIKDETIVRESLHVGNIGNLTTQTLIEQERELRKWNIVNDILNDVAGFLTLPIYL